MNPPHQLRLTHSTSIFSSLPIVIPCIFLEYILLQSHNHNQP